MPARITVDLDALAENFRRLSSLHNGPSAAVVKADAYGLGLAPVARKLWLQGCQTFFVAFAQEGAALRKLIGDAQIYVLSGAPASDVDILLEQHLTPVLNSLEQCQRWSSTGQAAALHIDTGMSRLGLPPETRPSDLPELEVELLLSHLACADEAEHPLTARQIAQMQMISSAYRAIYPSARTSLCNSAGCMSGQHLSDAAPSLNRLGIGLYGCDPRDTASKNTGVAAEQQVALANVLTFEAQVLQVRTIDAGVPVGYGSTFIAPQRICLATLNVGYADGLPRLLSNKGAVFFQGNYLPIRGRISMDAVQVQVDAEDVNEGDWMEVIGSHLLIDTVAAQAQTISYEILTGLGHRSERTYIGSID